MRLARPLIVIAVLLSGCRGDSDVGVAPAASATPSPMVVPAAAFGGQVSAALPPLNRVGPPRVSAAQVRGPIASVQMALNDAPTEVELRQLAASDVLALLQLAASVPGLQRLQIVATYPLPDATAVRQERKALDLTYSVSKVKDLELSASEPQRVFRAADPGSRVHPYLRDA